MTSSSPRLPGAQRRQAWSATLALLAMLVQSLWVPWHLAVAEHQEAHVLHGAGAHEAVLVPAHEHAGHLHAGPGDEHPGHEHTGETPDAPGDGHPLHSALDHSTEWTKHRPLPLPRVLESAAPATAAELALGRGVAVPVGWVCEAGRPGSADRSLTSTRGPPERIGTQL